MSVRRIRVRGRAELYAKGVVAFVLLLASWLMLVLGHPGLRLGLLARMVPESTKASSSFAISPVKLLAPAGNSTMTWSMGPSASRDESVVVRSFVVGSTKDR
jgi:hypothetical protein